MPKDYIPQGDREFNKWLDNFIRVAAPLKEQLGISDEAMDELISFSGTFTADLAAADLQRNRALQATKRKDETRNNGEPRVRSIVKQIQVSDAVDDPLRILLDISLPADRSRRRSPETPQHLSISIEKNMMVRLRWKAGENTRGAMYYIEMSSGESGNYTLLDVTPRQTYIHHDPPNQKVSQEIAEALQCASSHLPVYADYVFGKATSVEETSAQTFHLSATPNPASAQSLITFTLLKESAVKLSVFDAAGREVLKLFSGIGSFGENHFLWNTENLPQGVYFIRLEADGKSAQAQCAILR